MDHDMYQFLYAVAFGVIHKRWSAFKKGLFGYRIAFIYFYLKIQIAFLMLTCTHNGQHLYLQDCPIQALTLL